MGNGLQQENARLKKQLAAVQSKLAHSHQALKSSEAQQAAVAAQFASTLAEKDRRVAALEHQLKLLLAKVRGSRQERIDPNQLLLFSLEELEEITERSRRGSSGADGSTGPTTSTCSGSRI